MDARGEKLPDLSFPHAPMSHPPDPFVPNLHPRQSLLPGRPPQLSPPLRRCLAAFHGSLLLTAPPITPSTRTPFSSFPSPHPRDPDPLVSSCGASRRRPASTQGGAPRRSGGRGGGLANVSEKVRLLRADGSVAEMVLLCVSLLLLRPSPMTPSVLPQVL